MLELWGNSPCLDDCLTSDYKSFTLSFVKFSVLRTSEEKSNFWTLADVKGLSGIKYTGNLCENEDYAFLTTKHYLPYMC